MPKATSSAVTGAPVSHLTPSRSVNVHSVKSSFGVPRSVARSGTRIIWPVSCVVVVLRQLTRDQRGHDRVGVGVVEVRRVDRRGQTGGGQDGDGATLGGPLDRLRALPGRVRCRRRCCRGSRCRRWGCHRRWPCRRRRRRRRRRRGRASWPWPEPPPISSGALPFSPFVVGAHFNSRADVGQRRVLGSNASRTESPRRFRASVSTRDGADRHPQVEPVVGVERRRVRRPSCRATGMPVRPRPRKDSPASAATNAGRPSEIDTTIGCDQVGQQLLEQDLPGRHADHLGGEDELALAQREHLAADQPGQPHPAEDHQDDDQGGELGPLERVRVW